MAFDKKLLEIIVCPICRGKLELKQDKSRLVCHFDRVYFPINEGIPVLLEHEAQPIGVSAQD